MIVTPPFFLRWMLPEAVHWNVPTHEKKIFLTFDDGPTTDITYEILSILKNYNARATFFCVGENIIKHPKVFQAILAQGHNVGNHTHNHPDGLKNSNDFYYDNIEKCQKLHPFQLFRPPYGHISPLQVKYLSKQYSIILWSVLSYDFRPEISPRKCLKNVLEYSGQGSIVVFHDLSKAYSNMIFALPRFIEHFLLKGYAFEAIYPEALASKVG